MCAFPSLAIRETGPENQEAKELPRKAASPHEFSFRVSCPRPSITYTAPLHVEYAFMVENQPRLLPIPTPPLLFPLRSLLLDSFPAANLYSTHQPRPCFLLCNDTSAPYATSVECHWGGAREQGRREGGPRGEGKKRDKKGRGRGGRGDKFPTLLCPCLQRTADIGLRAGGKRQM